MKKLKSGLAVQSDKWCCKFFLEWGVNIVNPLNCMEGPSLSGNCTDIHLAASKLDKKMCSQLLGIFNRQYRDAVQVKYYCVLASTGTEDNLGAMTQALQNDGKKGLYGLWSNCGSG